MIYWSLDWDWQAGTVEYQKSYDLDPTDANSAAALGNSLFFFHGESDTVLALFRKGNELDPINSNSYVINGGYYMLTGKLPEAETAFRKAIDLLPTGSSALNGLSSMLLLRGEAAAALAYFALGRRAGANAVLSEMECLDATTHASNIAGALAYRGEINQAFAWLDRAYQQHEASLAGVNRDPLTNSLPLRAALESIPAQDEPSRIAVPLL